MSFDRAISHLHPPLVTAKRRLVAMLNDGSRDFAIMAELLEDVKQHSLAIDRLRAEEPPLLRLEHAAGAVGREAAIAEALRSAG